MVTDGIATSQMGMTRQRAAHSLKATSYIPGFDGLRAAAVLVVLISHVGFGEIVPGGLGVTVFFTISGFLITSLLIKELDHTGRVDLKLFYVRRILRLYPELIALVLCCLIAGIALDLRTNIIEIFACVLYYMNYYSIFGVHYDPMKVYPWRQLWSLAVEEHFYLIFPFLLILAGTSLRRRLGISFALIILPSLWRYITYYTLNLPWQYNYVATDTRIDSIAWGCLMAVLLHDAGKRPKWLNRCRFIAPWIVPIAGALLISTLIARSEDFRWTSRFTLQGAAIALLIANILFDSRWRGVVRILEWRPIRFTGRISYGLYLYHMLVNRIIEELWPAIIPRDLLVLSLVCTYLVALLSYQLLEVPLKGVRHRFGSHVR